MQNVKYRPKLSYVVENSIYKKAEVQNGFVFKNDNKRKGLWGKCCLETKRNERNHNKHDIHDCKQCKKSIN